MRRFLKITRIAIEELWRVMFLVWVLPPAIIELLWLLIVDRQKLKEIIRQFSNSKFISLEIWK